MPIRLAPTKANLYEEMAPPPNPPLRYPDTLGTLIEIRESNNKGLGVFALADIPAGTILLSEGPLVTLIDTGTRADPLDAAVASLTPAQTASFFSLSHYSRNPNESLNRSIIYSNGYSIMQDLATGLFETASRINHSCIPNSAYMWKESVGRMIFWNRCKLVEGEEVTVNYGHKRTYLKRIYGFECDCGGCIDVEGGGNEAKSVGFVNALEGAVKEQNAMGMHEGDTKITPSFCA
jgi:hypothetical protein